MMNVAKRTTPKKTLQPFCTGPFLLSAQAASTGL